MLFAKGGMIKVISKVLSRILSSFCILALCFGVFVKFYGIIWGISLGYFKADWVILCVSGPMLLYAAIALFFELLNFKSRFFPKGLWIVLIWLDIFINGIFLCFYVFNHDYDKTATVAGVESKTECHWDDNMDVILEIYTCQMDPNCKHLFKELKSFYDEISPESKKCLLDSLAKMPTANH